MNFFFSFAVFCLIFLLLSAEYHRNVKFDWKRVRITIFVFVMALAFSYLLDVTKWLLLMLFQH